MTAQSEEALIDVIETVTEGDQRPVRRTSGRTLLLDEALVRNYFYNIDETISVLQMLHDNIPHKLDYDHKEAYIESPTIMAKNRLYCFGTTFSRTKSFIFHSKTR